jgi:hypothetical protein
MDDIEKHLSDDTSKGRYVYRPQPVKDRRRDTSSTTKSSGKSRRVGQGGDQYFNDIKQLFKEKSKTLGSLHDTMRAFFRKHV